MIVLAREPAMPAVELTQTTLCAANYVMGVSILPKTTVDCVPCPAVRIKLLY